MHDYPGRLWKLDETEMTARSHSPGLGEHNDYVLGQIAGMTPEEISELEREGITGTVPVGQ